MVKHIVWAHDGTPSAERALPVVKDLAASTGAKLTIGSVRRDWHIGHRPVLVDDRRSLEEELRHRVDELIAEGFGAHLALATSDRGHPAQAIVDIAEGVHADLIVAGSHARGPVAGLVVGSFTSHLIKVAHCPVLIVPWRPHQVDHGAASVDESVDQASPN